MPFIYYDNKMLAHIMIQRDLFMPFKYTHRDALEARRILVNIHILSSPVTHTLCHDWLDEKEEPSRRSILAL